MNASENDVSQPNNNVNTQNYSQDVPQDIDYYIEQYGQLPEGENPWRNIRFPQKTGDNARTAVQVVQAQRILKKLSPEDQLVGSVNDLQSPVKFYFEGVTL